MQLRGEWVATVADDDVRRNGIAFETDTTDWTPIEVPGHWQHSERFADSAGPVVYRRNFSIVQPEEHRRRFLTLDGVFYQADVWLDGAYLGDAEGYFFPHTFDITALSHLDRDHVVAIEVSCPRDDAVRGRRLLTGAYHDPAVVGLVNPGGLWRPVHVFDTGPVRVARLRVLCREADSRRAHLRIGVRLDNDAQRVVTIRTSVSGVVADELTTVIATGDNDLEWGVDVTDPALWWPRALGDQPLTDVAVEVLVDGERSDRRMRRTGLRSVSWSNWVCSVNGERIFLKGANLSPITAAPADATAELVARDVDLAIDLGLDALRVNAHVASRAFYDAADVAGVLILQEFPLSGTYLRSIRRPAVTQARAMVDTLGHHPSIVSWTAHDAPAGARDASDRTGWRGTLERFGSEQLPSWNRSVLDRWVKRSIERADETRPTVPHSGVPPHLPLLDGTDSHLWYGWRTGEATDLARSAARLPRRVRFVGEFGAHSAPLDATAIPGASGRWPDLDWDTMVSAAGYDRETFEHRFPPDAFDSYESWARASQEYQAHVLKVQIETLRRLKYRPTGGFCFSTLLDSAPTISPSVLDHRRLPKLAFDAVRSACAPLIVVADPLPDELRAGESLDVDVHVVSDLRVAIDFAVVDVAATWPGGEQRWRFGGPIPADDVVKVGRVRFNAPDVGGAMTLDVRLDAGDHSAENGCTAIITLG